MERSDYQEAAVNRAPPCDLEAEAAVLSAMLSDEDARAAACETLAGSDFYRAENQAVFEAIVSLMESNTPVDLITVKNQLEKRGAFDNIGGLATLSAIAGAVSTTVNTGVYARIVSEKAVLRRLIKAARDIEAACHMPEKTVDQALEEAQKAVFDIATKRKARDFVHIKEALGEALDEIEKAYKGEKTRTVATGFADMDRLTAGLHPSDLILFAARPSMGKTALGLNIAQHAAVNNGVTTAFFSLEMSRVQLAARLISSGAMVDANCLRTGDFGQDAPKAWEKIVGAIGPLADAPLYLDDTPGVSVSEVRRKCRKLKMEKGLGLVVIDYLQLMSGSSNRPENRQQEISEISRSLKALAREFEVPVIALAQLSRACETRADHRPILSDLRESGAIEQDADLVGFIYRDEYYNPETEKRGVAEVIIAKQRNGGTGSVELLYFGNFVKFVDKERDVVL